MNISIACFSNCTNDCIEKPTIYETLYSLGVAFKDAWQSKTLRVYVDPNPNKGKYKEYTDLLTERGFFVEKTKGLADGYLRAVHQAYEDGAEFVFMVEHDWQFQPDNIEHTLADITFRMKKDNIPVMLFNKHVNDDKLNGTKWQGYFEPVPKKFYCKTDRFSNNPHIINVEMFKKMYMDMVDWTVPGAGHIEQSLQKKVDIAVYGMYGNEPAIKHLDGRKGGKK